jgi:ubiquinone/menaquinone biosynthesis C-methylase UbiE
MSLPALRPARLPKRHVPLVYTAIAPTHDLLATRVEARARAMGLDWLSTRDGETVLEVAVGTGLSFQTLLVQNPHGWTEGVDAAPAMLARARRRAARATATHGLPGRYGLRLGDAYALPFPDGSFDALVNSYMFDLLPVADFPLVLAEFRRVLRPGGRLVQVNMTTPRRGVEAIWEGLYRLHPALLGGCRGVRTAPHLWAAGFEAVRRTHVSQRTFPSEVVFGRKPR